MKVADLMIAPVVVTQRNKTVKHIREILERKHINAIPVLSTEGEIEGIITAGDVVNETDENKLAEAIMTPKTLVVSKHSGLQDAAKMMNKHHVHHLVVMDDGQVVGMLSSMDFVRYVAEG